MTTLVENELHKAAIRYHVKEMTRSIVVITILFCFAYLHILDYRIDWLWIAESCRFVLLLYSFNKIYKREKVKLEKTMDTIFSGN